MFVKQHFTVQANSASPSDKTLNNNASEGNGIKVTDNKKPVFESAETLRLKEMYDRLNKRATPVQQTGNGHYLKIHDGEHKRLWFDHSKTTEEDVTYPSDPNRPVHRVKFYVREIINGKKSDVEEEWTTSVRTSTQVLKWLLKGYYEIDITRFGSEKNDTRYEVDPVL